MQAGEVTGALESSRCHDRVNEHQHQHQPSSPTPITITPSHNFSTTTTQRGRARLYLFLSASMKIISNCGGSSSSINFQAQPGNLRETRIKINKQERRRQAKDSLLIAENSITHRQSRKRANKLVPFLHIDIGRDPLPECTSGT